MVLVVVGLVAMSFIGTTRTGGPKPGGQGPDNVALAALMNPLSSLPDGFSVMDRSQLLPPRSPASGPCLSPADGVATVDWSTSSSYQLRPNGTEAGHLTISATALPSTDILDRERAYFATPAYRTCLQQEAADQLAAGFQRGSGATVGSGTTKPVTDHLPAVGDEFLTKTDYTYVGGTALATERVVHLYRGRFMVRLTVNYCSCAPFPDASVTELAVTELTSRMQALPQA